MKAKKKVKKVAKGRGAKVRRAPEEVTPNVRKRLSLMRQIIRLVEQKEWRQTEAAERCGVTQPRMNDLLRGRVDRFSLDALVNIAVGLGRKVTVKME